MLRNDVCDHISVWIAVISTGRPSAPKAYRDLVGRATWYVSPGEAEAYRASGAERVVEVVGLSAARNAALEEAFSEGAWCLQLSDDIGAFAYAKPREDCTNDVRRYVRTKATLEELVTDLWMAGVEHRARLIGVAPTHSLIFYNHTNPTGTRNFVLGDCMLIRPNPLRFDERICLKEDYDYTAQHLVFYGVAARRNQWLIDVAHRRNSGGAVDRRTLDLEEETIDYLQDKWGTQIIRRNPRKPGEIHFRWPN